MTNQRNLVVPQTLKIMMTAARGRSCSPSTFTFARTAKEEHNGRIDSCAKENTCSIITLTTAVRNHAGWGLAASAQCASRRLVGADAASPSSLGVDGGNPAFGAVGGDSPGWSSSSSMLVPASFFCKKRV